MRIFKPLLLAALVSAVAATPAAAAMENNVMFQIDVSLGVSCAVGGVGEAVELSGNFHVMSIDTQVAGNDVLVIQHFQPAGISGIGLTTGALYHAVGGTLDDTITTGGATVVTFINNFRIIGQGPDNNVLIHLTAHTTVNADGTTTTQVDNAFADCS